MTGLVVIGLMSGTSVDGIDAAVLKTDGQNFQALGCPSVYDYRDETRDAIWTAVANPDAHVRDESMRVNLDRLIAEDHARAVLKLIDADGFNPTLIGFHGQTIYHNPAGRIEHPLGRDTIQLGNASLLAQITNLPVVYDMRSADMAAGGEGAPLAPVFHAAMLGRLNVGLPAVLVNVGGVANLTWFDGHDGLIGFDTGPGNALMDDYMRRYCDAAFDKNGELAASGTADWQLVHDWLRMPFFAANWAQCQAGTMDRPPNISRRFYYPRNKARIYRNPRTIWSRREPFASPEKWHRAGRPRSIAGNFRKRHPHQTRPVYPG